MKITILGNQGPFPGAGGACSGYLLQTDNTKILIDCGSGVLSNLQKFCQFREIDAIILSHLHSDHISDMQLLGYAILTSRIRKAQQSINSIPVFCPNNPKSEFERLSKEEFEINQIADGLKITIKDIQVSFGLMNHPYENYAISFENDGKKFVYSGDTSYTEKLIEFSKEADLLIGDSGFTNSLHETAKKMNIKLVHMTAEQNAIVAKKAGVKKLLLTHFYPYDDLNIYLNEAKAVFKNVKISEILKSYEI